MSRLLVVSNRLPVSIEQRKNSFNIKPSVGGLATGLGSFYKSYDSSWLGWCGITSDNLSKNKINDIEIKLKNDYSNIPLFLTENEVNKYYYGFCNRTIWPLFHCFTQYVIYDEKQWECYKKVNKKFCDAIIKIAEPDDNIWINDYHLMLLPTMLRKELPDAKISFFLHIPFPPFEIFHLIPWRKEILEGLLGADLIGFHIYDYVHNFLDSVYNILGYDHTLGEIITNDRILKVDSFPMGIDYERYANAIELNEVRRNMALIRRRMGKYKLILSVDRLDYTKGIIQRLEAFEQFLDKYPEYQGKVSLIQVSAPSRTKVYYYQQLKKEVDELVGRINGKYRTFDWNPIWYFYRSFPLENMAALYNMADIALVTPIKDGMNLIAKEFVATKSNDKGVLILSEMAGAAKEMSEAIIVNPNDTNEVIEAIHQAIEMNEDEQIRRNKQMQFRLKRYNVRRWAEDFMDSLDNIKNRQNQLTSKYLNNEVINKIVQDYSIASNRLLALDLDGTLIPSNLEGYTPDKGLLDLLKKLSNNPKNKIVILSGRQKYDLEQNFANINVGLIAEHGALIKRNGEWENIEPLDTDWMTKILPIIEFYVDRTPRSFIQQKEFSIVWNYKNVNKKLADIRSIELKNTLKNMALSTNMNLNILQGAKFIEIKQAGINKDRALSFWLDEKNWDFILAAGDDITDESVFEVLPHNSYSIKVGLTPTEAKWYIDSSEKLIRLLKKLK
ncbi:MAG: bifunctional alpha,alpha-trehalose-phosphate synthase (UDP-forming)/trehalose-phosphatase [Bacteroidales bacterium]|nr:bifunctional alpha,alpha-trehalose-phosphate synthase (UDP-forming)/trehalose-phosphatase [Bacteroidales bacterium]MDI3479764.1 trehalose 6-phosphate synthase/phosphatase [Rikenellaceae bacterium]